MIFTSILKLLEVADYRMRISNLERMNEEERVKHEAEIQCLKEELKSKEEEIKRIKEDYKKDRDKEIAVCERDKALLKVEIMKKEVTISNMKTKEQSLRCELEAALKDTAIAQKTIAEHEAAKMKVEIANIKEKYASMKEELERRKDS